MSLIITLTTQEGIVMASDSRLTINNTRTTSSGTILDAAVSQSDTNYKTFLAAGSIGISTYGAATVKGVPLSGYIDSFIREKIDSNTAVDAVPPLLLEYVKHLPELPDSGFHIGGYTKDATGRKMPFVSRVYAKNSQTVNVVPSQQVLGAMWDGEADVMVRILNQNLFIKMPPDKFDPLVNYTIPFNMFTLQDAIDFAVYAVRTTSDTMKFQLRYKTVGGPIDVLVITPDKGIWLSRKTLQVNCN